MNGNGGPYYNMNGGGGGNNYHPGGPPLPYGIPMHPQHHPMGRHHHDDNADEHDEPTPICRCRVLYLGSAVPHVTKDGLQGIQEPLKELSIRDVQVAWRKNKDSQFNFFMRFKVELVILAILTLLAVTLPVYCFFKWKKNLTNREQERRVMFQERPIVIAPPAQQALEMQPLVRQGTLSRDISPRPTAPPLRQAPNLNLSLSDLPHVIGQ